MRQSLKAGAAGDKDGGQGSEEILSEELSGSDTQLEKEISGYFLSSDERSRMPKLNLEKAGHAESTFTIELDLLTGVTY